MYAWMVLNFECCGIIHCESKTLDPFLFKHNFGKYCSILMILSLLQTDINYDKVYHKIYHHTWNLLVHYLVKWQECIGHHYWHDFIIKDVIVKKVTWNVTDNMTDTLCIADSSVTSWSSIEEVSKRYHQNYLLCNNNEVTSAVTICQILFSIDKRYDKSKLSR